MMITSFHCNIYLLYLFSFINGIQETWRKTLCPYIVNDLLDGKKGIASYFAIGGTSLSSNLIWWSMTSFWLINPTDQRVKTEDHENELKSYYFMPQVANNVPNFMLLNSFAFYGIGIM